MLFVIYAIANQVVLGGHCLGEMLPLPFVEARAMQADCTFNSRQ
jgi:hypothetical protein